LYFQAGFKLIDSRTLAQFSGIMTTLTPVLFAVILKSLTMESWQQRTFQNDPKE